MVMDLIIIDMPHFDMIPGMDFLSKYEAEINYKKKKVKFSINDDDQLTFGEGQILSMMVSSIKAKKILSKQCMTYLVHVVQKLKEIVSSIKDTLMVQEFLDVFLDNLLGLALERGRVLH